MDTDDVFTGDSEFEFEKLRRGIFAAGGAIVLFGELLKSDWVGCLGDLACGELDLELLYEFEMVWPCIFSMC
jgi:hypothetical protein